MRFIESSCVNRRGYVRRMRSIDPDDHSGRVMCPCCSGTPDVIALGLFDIEQGWEGPACVGYPGGPCANHRGARASTSSTSSARGRRSATSLTSVGSSSIYVTTPIDTSRRCSCRFVPLSCASPTSTPAILARFVVEVSLAYAYFRPPQTVPGSRGRHGRAPHEHGRGVEMWRTLEVSEVSAAP